MLDGALRQATYAGAFDVGEIVGVAAHCWNGMLLVQAPPARVATSVAHELARATSRAGRAVTGFSGPADQVAVIREAFALPLSVDEIEQRYTLALADLRVPDALGRGDVRSTASERSQVVAWRRAYCLETLATTDGDELVARVVREIGGALARAQLWVLESGDAIVAMTAFNARSPGTAEVGGVYTPPEHRSRGYADRLYPTTRAEWIEPLGSYAITRSATHWSSWRARSSFHDNVVNDGATFSLRSLPESETSSLSAA